jgi:hypothetical protein
LEKWKVLTLNWRCLNTLKAEDFLTGNINLQVIICGLKLFKGVSYGKEGERVKRVGKS